MASAILTLAVLSSAFLLTHSMEKCSIGSFHRGKKCVLCPPGTYQNKEGAKTCIPCPKGYFNPYRGAQGIDLCEACPAGTFGPRKGSPSRNSCKPCPKGKNSVVGSSKCISCPPGQVISKCGPFPMEIPPKGFVGVCADCFRGCTFSPENLKCWPCREHDFSMKKNAFQCRPCPQMTGSGTGATKCKTCPAGSGFGGSGGTDEVCTPCGEDKFNDGKSAFCEICPLGSKPEKKSASTKCVPCPEGTKGEDLSQCVPCKPGENLKAIGAHVCTPDNKPCPRTYFRNKNGACVRCASDERRDVQKNECVPCGENETSDVGISTKCTKCAPKSSLDFDCRTICIAGYRKRPELKTDKCFKCPPGFFNDNDARGASSGCQPCESGTFAPNPGMTKCLPCPPGTVRPFLGPVFCSPCPKGLRPELPVPERCVDPKTNCAPSETREEDSGFISCNQKLDADCPEGLFKVVSGKGEFKRASCSGCSNSDFYDPIRNRCRRCPRGLYSNGGVDTKCRPCPDGTAFDGRVCS